MEYQPLDKKKNEIRVLRFLDVPGPVFREGLIQCCIENVSLDYSVDTESGVECSQDQQCRIRWDAFTRHVDLRDSTLEQTRLDKATYLGLSKNHSQPGTFRYPWGDFEALSYTWSEEGDIREILINGNRREVSKNLEGALRALRELQETHSGMRYWVDSLCIDQGNIWERNEQVKRMREIYSKARAVIVWLGQEEGMDRNAVQTMRHLCRNPCVEEPLWLPGNLQLEGWYALCAFMQKPYWNRSWIIQELAMNHNSTLILCGKFKLTRRMVRLGAIYCQDLLRASEDNSYKSGHYLESDAWSMASRMYRLTSLTFNPHVEVNLDLLLNLVRRADATDKKDKVYGILGLLDPAISAGIFPDYTLAEQQVFTNFMISIIQTTKRLEQIIFGGIPTSEGWPSWVPDWRMPFERHHIRYLRSRRASGSLTAKVRFFKKDDKVFLVCSGFQVDTVDSVTARTSGISVTQSQNTSNRYGSRTSEALQQTLLMNHPGASGKLTLEVPWSSRSHGPSNFYRSSKWPKLFKSTYFQRFDQFRLHNQDFLVGGKSLRSFFPESGKSSVDTGSILQCMRLTMLSLDGRTLIRTRTGYLGLAPEAILPGDLVVILMGCRCPIVLRPCNDNFYHVVGECYIHGIMDGEILNQREQEDIAEREFVLC